MSTTKAVKKGYVKKVGNRSKKRSGEISTSLRMTVENNKRLHRAAKADNRSFNIWATLTLLREADKVLARAEKLKTEKTLG